MNQAAAPKCCGEIWKGWKPDMLRVRVVVPIFVVALSVMAALVPFVVMAAGDSAAVTIHDGGDMSAWGYGPNATTISVGQTVTFTNTGSSPHDATSADGSWKTPLLQSGASASVTFPAAGTFSYTCVLHPWMKGTIVVTQATSAPAPASTSPDASTTVINAPAPAPPASDVAPAINPAPQTDAAPTQTSDAGDGSSGN